MYKKSLCIRLIAIALVAILFASGFGLAEVSAKSIKLNKKKIELKVGDTFQLKLKRANGTIDWASGDESIATVSEEGVVTAVSSGKTKITATFSGISYACTVKVLKIKLNYKTYELKEGESFMLELSGPVESFRSANEHVASVKETGEVTGVTMGKTAVIATGTNGKDYKCTVEVVYNEEYHIHKVAYISSKNPTCTEYGLTLGEYCQTCGKVITEQQVIPAKGHTFENGKCKVCGAEDPDYKPPHEHKFINVSKEPTCTEAGFTEKVYCETCGQVFLASKEIKALGHDFKNGYCTRCGASEIHEFVTVKGKSPTCTEAGSTDYVYCKICGEIQTFAEIIPPLGHEYKGGDSCIRCGADKYGHIHTWVIQKPVAPTCTKVGYTEGKYCSTCGYIAYAQQFVSPLHHTYKDGKCIRCGKKEE